MTGGEAVATQFPAPRSAYACSRWSQPGDGLAWRPIGRWRMATAAMSRLGGPMPRSATTRGKAGLADGCAAWTFH